MHIFFPHVQLNTNIMGKLHFAHNGNTIKQIVAAITQQMYLRSHARTDKVHHTAGEETSGAALGGSF